MSPSTPPDAGSRQLFRWLRAIGYRLVPGSCALCGLASGRDLDLCPACETDLPWIERACPRCALPLPAAADAPPCVCGICLQRPPRFTRSHAPLRYAFPVDQLILALKFQRRRELAAVLACAVAPRLRALYAETLPEILVPVPLHRRRLRERGYNQAEIIARALGRILALPVAGDAVTRVRDTAAQSALPAGRRRSNLRGAFRVDHVPPGDRIAIVDDVLTTGSTAGELASALLAAGAGEVHVWTLARSGAPAGSRLNLGRQLAPAARAKPAVWPAAESPW